MVCLMAMCKLKAGLNHGTQKSQGCRSNTQHAAGQRSVPSGNGLLSQKKKSDRSGYFPYPIVTFGTNALHNKYKSRWSASCGGC